MDWAAIIAMILEFIKECQANRRTDEQITSSLRRPRGLEVLRLRRGLRQRFNLSGRRLAEAVEDVMADAACLTDEDCAELLLQAAAPPDSPE